MLTKEFLDRDYPLASKVLEVVITEEPVISNRILYYLPEETTNEEVLDTLKHLESLGLTTHKGGTMQQRGPGAFWDQVRHTREGYELYLGLKRDEKYIQNHFSVSGQNNSVAFAVDGSTAMNINFSDSLLGKANQEIENLITSHKSDLTVEVYEILRNAQAVDIATEKKSLLEKAKEIARKNEAWVSIVASLGVIINTLTV